jgi:ABC-type phosphate transport system substrate-binding protein
MFLKVFIFISVLSLPLFAEIVVVVNANSDIGELNKKEIKSIFLGKKKRFSNGKKIILVDQKVDSEVYAPFYIVTTGKNPSQLNKYRVKRIFTGLLKAPKKLSSTSEIIAFLKSNENAIAYLKVSEVVDSLKVIYTLK